MLYDQIGGPKESYYEAARLREELHMDSLDMVEMLMDVEDTFEIDVPDDIAEKWKTVNDVIDYVGRRV